MSDPIRHGWDLPYEPASPDATINLGDCDLAGEVTVAAGLVPVDPSIDPRGLLPVVIFNFGDSPVSNKRIPPVVLALDTVRLRSVPALVEQAVTDAIRQAQERTQ